jgi:transposase-like protein
MEILDNMSKDREERAYIQHRWATLSEEERMQHGSALELVKQWREQYQSEHKVNGVEFKNRGARFNISPEKSVIDEVKEAMRVFPERAAEAAKSIGINKDNFSFIRKLIVLSERPALSRDDKEKIKNCFDFIEKERQVTGIKQLGGDIIARNWIKRKDPNYVITHRRERFDRTVMAINESCESTIEMALPEINKEDTMKAIGALSRSIELISKLTRRLIGEAEEK